MAPKKETSLAPLRDPFALLRQMTSDWDRMFESSWPGLRWPAFLGAGPEAKGEGWLPHIDVFEKDNRLVTKIDLPGMKKEDVKVEVTDGHLSISGERKTEAEEKKENYYRCERQYGSFSRVVPLPDGVKLEDVVATFAEGVLEVSMPLPAKAETKSRTVEVQDGSKTAGTAA